MASADLPDVPVDIAVTPEPEVALGLAGTSVRTLVRPGARGAAMKNILVDKAMSQRRETWMPYGSIAAGKRHGSRSVAGQWAQREAVLAGHLNYCCTPEPRHRIQN